MNQSEKRPPLDFDYIKAQATGHWLSRIFPAVGISFKGNPKKHQPCPCCGGKDRFRCDDKQGNGTWICNNCGAGNGIDLVIKYTGQSVRDAYKTVAGVLGIDGGRAMSDAERQAWRAKQKQHESATVQHKVEIQEQTAIVAQKQWQSASVCDRAHEYLQRKCIVGEYLRQDGDALLAPLYYTDIEHGTHKLVNIQRIMPDGEKRFLKGGRQKDCYFAMGAPTEVVFIGEGVATCGSVYEAFDRAFMTICAYNAGNLKSVAQIIRHLLPSARIIFIADNDAATASGKHGENVGIVKATEAAQTVGGVVVYPILNGGEDEY